MLCHRKRMWRVILSPEAPFSLPDLVWKRKFVGLKWMQAVQCADCCAHLPMLCIMTEAAGVMIQAQS